MTTHEVLVAARNELDRRGLAKRTVEDDEGRVCARGAICFVPVPVSQHEAADKALAEALSGAPAGPSWASRAPVVVDFNNHPDRTKEEVLGAFDKAIAATAPEPFDPLSGDLSPAERNPALGVGLDHEGPQKPAYEPVGL